MICNNHLIINMITSTSFLLQTLKYKISFEETLQENDFVKSFSLPLPCLAGVASFCRWPPWLTWRLRTGVGRSHTTLRHTREAESATQPHRQLVSLHKIITPSVCSMVAS